MNQVVATSVSVHEGTRELDSIVRWATQGGWRNQRGAAGAEGGSEPGRPRICARTTVVRGNNDRSKWSARLTLRDVVEAGGAYLYLVHEIADLDLVRRLKASRQ